MSKRNKKQFWVICFAILIWSILRTMEYISQILLKQEALENISPSETSLYQQVPLWINIIYFSSIAFGLLAAISLLFKQRIAKTFFGLSLITTVSLWAYNTLMNNSIVVYGPGGMIMPYIIIIASILSYLYARYAFKNGYID